MSATTNRPSRDATQDLDPIRASLGQALFEALTTLLPTPSSTLAIAADALGRLLERPPESRLGDYALPCFRFAKELRRAPPDIAQALASALKPGHGYVASATAAGAFLNLRVDSHQLASAVVEPALSGATFAKSRESGQASGRPRVMIEFSQPNTHKVLHVGHGRNVCLGHALVRLHRYCGYDVVAANYPGDDGTHIATELWHISEHGLAAPEDLGRSSSAIAARNAWLGKMYVDAKTALAAMSDPEKAAATAKISGIHRQIESQEGEVFALWQKTRQWSLDDFFDLYRWLGVEFDVYFYESEMSQAAQAIVDEFLAKGVFIRDQGAVGVDLKAHKLGFCILRKGDGNTLYATKDLALARRKFEEFRVDRSVYVVADEQNHHFRQVFKVLELMGFPQAQQCHHLSYGMVVLPEGKMSSRDGSAVSFRTLIELVATAVGNILAKYEGDWSPAEIAEATHRLADGAIKYGMVSTDPAKEIVFNLDDWVSFEGHSGPYLMYGYTRTRSILRKAADLGFKPNPNAASELVHEAEVDLLRHLYDFNQVVAAACDHFKPSLLAGHLYQMCKAFNRFYVDVSVLKAENDRLRGARLALIAAFGETLRQGLYLLGITPPERM